MLQTSVRLKPSVGSPGFPQRPRPKEPFSFGEGLAGREGQGRERVGVCEPLAGGGGLAQLLGLASSFGARLQGAYPLLGWSVGTPLPRPPASGSTRQGPGD